MDIQATPADIERLLSQSDWLSALARKLVGDASTADDLVQDTWIAALQNPPDPDRPVRPWLAGILRRVASMRARAEGRRSWRQRRAARKDELPSAAFLVGEVDLQQRLSREVLELNEPYRTTLLLRYFHDLSAVEIARRQGIPAGTVRWRLKRGLDDLRARLDRSFGDRRSWCLALVGLARREPAAGASATSSATTVAATAAVLVFLGLGTWALVDRGRFEEAPELPRVAGLDSPVTEPSTIGLEAGEDARSAIAPETEPVGSLLLRIVEPRGHATGGLHAVALHADGTVTELTSDDGGLVRFTGRLDGGEGVIWVDRPGSFIAPVRFAHARGLQELRLPDGVEFSGHARHAGDAVPAGFVLELDSDRMLSWGPLPEPVTEFLNNGRRARTTTDDQGRFAFHALPSNHSGELWVPPGWRLAEHAPRGSSGPKHDCRHVFVTDKHIDLDVAPMPAVRGSVQHANGAPASGVLVNLRMRWTGEGRGREEATTDEDGTFVVELARADLVHLVVTVEHADTHVRATQRRRPTAPPLEELDLGILTLSDGPPGVIAVRGTAGLLSGAWLRFAGADYGPSGADGRIEPPTAGRGWIGAMGYRPTFVEWDAGRPEEVRLDPLTSARVRVLDAEGAPLPGLSLQLPRAPDQEVPPMRLLELTTGPSKTVHGRAAASLDGWIELVDLPALEVLSLPLLDVLGRPLDSVTIPPLALGERRELTHVLAESPRRLFGRCLDASGKVLLGVELNFETENGDTSRARSDPEGRFELAGLAPETLVVTVGKRGFLRRRVTIAPAELGRAQEIRLDRSCDLVVHAVDPSGQPHERLELHALHGELRWAASETAAGVYTLLDLPPEPLTLEWSRGGHRASVDWDPGFGPAELEIGPGGSTIRAR